MENNSNSNKEEESKKVQQQKQTSEKMAIKFPNWDLLPPNLLVQRDIKK